jgi:hypothetical protein
MNFFIPRVGADRHQTTYDNITKIVKDQLGTVISERRVFSINYVHDKKKRRAEVGQLDPQMGRYEVAAIFESKPHIVFTRAIDGGKGLTMLVSSEEITDIEYFD